MRPRVRISSTWRSATARCRSTATGHPRFPCSQWRLARCLTQCWHARLSVQRARVAETWTEPCTGLGPSGRNREELRH
jgi:hypothetical protein